MKHFYFILENQTDFHSEEYLPEILDRFLDFIHDASSISVKSMLYILNSGDFKINHMKVKPETGAIIDIQHVNGEAIEIDLIPIKDHIIEKNYSIQFLEENIEE